MSNWELIAASPSRQLPFIWSGGPVGVLCIDCDEVMWGIVSCRMCHRDIPKRILDRRNFVNTLLRSNL